ncbi:DNA starvation/stationary phase protection protein [Pacificimonas flava]|uniref:DNA starvation/stationary phase protection protein n=2 Tax=Pacificimonas TaxID=1960290 RepID=A0A219B536_9SPHN|nr:MULTISPECIES: DNA starvation/stationary phase protection protein [Pacificimonas]MBZ6379543.1 DNA starvation/stationary phase protection protein [Pacificimonas aurantium]OWV33273.1 DNA starvation/stationary phase protection protein [Pacificimonas flava]
MATATKDPTPHIGVNTENRQKVGKELGKVLADSYTLYLKTHNFHWNVRGPHFHALHNLFEEQYTELAAAVDEIAERIRALGVDAPGSYRQFADLNSIDEAPDTPPEALAMAEQLAHDHEAVAKTCRATLGIAEEAEDEVSVDMMVERMTVHDKAAWMLRSIAA